MVLEMSILIMKYILTRLYLGSADRWYKYALAKKEEYEVVKDLDKCLECHEKYKNYMHVLGYPIPPEREAFFQQAYTMRERYAQAQKDKEDNESLQRINAFFARI
jgi:hypothetical protein